MHPYRDMPAAVNESRKPSEELVLHAALVAIGIMPIVDAVARAIPWGVPATVGTLMAAVGLVGLWNLHR
jgi:hypothetical protein